MCLFAPLFFFVALRALDILSDEVLVELSAAYRRMVSHLPPLETSQSVSSFAWLHCLPVVCLLDFFFSKMVILDIVD